MRMKLVALLGAGLLLAGCGAADADAPSTAPTEEVAGEWDDKTFCEALNDQRDDYQETLDSEGPLSVSDLEPYEEWANALKTMADSATTEDVATFTAPVYVTENSTVDLLDVFMAGNRLGRHCLTSD